MRKGTARMDATADRVIAFGAADGSPLKLHVFMPDGPPRAALLLFHGGGWLRGSPSMLFPHARALAQTGTLTASAGYRLVRKGARNPLDCLADAACADDAFRTVAAESGLSQTFVGGGSAGAQMALALAAPPSFLAQPARTYAGLVLFNPAVDLAGTRGALASLVRRRLRVTSADASTLSPLRHVRRGMPPSVVLHGTADRVVPIATARCFREAMTEAGNICELVELPGAGHGFFLQRPGGNPLFARATEVAADFVRSHAGTGTGAT